MSYYTIISNLFADLSEQQQEIIAGGADFELAGSNFANRLVVLQGSVSSGPNGSFANSSGQSSQVNTAAQDFLGLGAPSIPNIPALGSAPVLNGLPARPRTSLGGLTGLRRLGGLGNLRT
ncbi:CTB family bacteriocin [Anabaena azotica]|uniref:CTB family bacteriocin n=1 Tax=Anabaena azotica TaxID=197653 RepID=UPI0039A45771